MAHQHAYQHSHSAADPHCDQRAGIAAAAAEDRTWPLTPDLLVLPTRYDPFGMVVVEAMAAGMPVLARPRMK